MNKMHSILSSLHKTDALLAFVLKKARFAFFVFDVTEEILEIHKKSAKKQDTFLQFFNFYNTELKNSGFDENYILEFKQYIKKFANDKKGDSFEYLGDHIDDVFQWHSLSCFSYLDPLSTKQYIIGLSQALATDEPLNRFEEDLLSQKDDSKTVISSFKINISRQMIEEYNRFNGKEIKMKAISFDEANKLDFFKVFPNKDAFPFDFKNLDKFTELVKNGSKQFVFERRVLIDNVFVWVEIHILFTKQKITNEVFAHCYVLDINNLKILSILTEQHIFFEYDHLAYIEVDTGTFYYIQSPLEQSYLKKSEFDKYISFFLKTIVVEEDRTYAKEQLVLKKIVKALEERRFHTIYLGLYAKEGEYQRKKLTFTFVNNEKNILALSVSDVTDFYKAEEEKRQSLYNALEIAQNASFAKTEFLSRMSHELRTPLNAIMGLVVLAQQKALENKPLLENLGKINSSAHYLLTIINDVLDMSRIESGKLQMSKGLIVIQELVAKVNAIIESQAKQKEIQYTWEIAESVYHSFVGDELKLQQVLINILGNAVKFTPDGGKVHLLIEQVFFFNTEQKRKLRITISDTGIGIEKKFLPHIFDAFSQDVLKTRSELAGTGLGLAISKNLITIMGGTISVKSLEGEGTSFFIELVLPIYDEEMQNKKNNVARSENQTYTLPNVVDTTAIPAKGDSDLGQLNTSFYRGNRILLVDDNRMNLDVAEQLLIGRGFSIDIATNGKEAVEKFENSKEGFYNLILMDVRMPQMDGLEATRTIRALEHPNAQTIPIIAMTANAFAEDIKATQESGMNAHLSKPIDTEILFQTIACFISGFC